jgi:hypothetical protein
MGMTIIEKILARASGAATVAPGDLAVVDVDLAVLIDLSFSRGSWREVLKVHDPDKVVVVFDHDVPASNRDTAAMHVRGREFVRRFGIRRFHDVGPDQGISHVVVAENAYCLPGTVMACSDSHTCSAGALNCAARGLGAPDLLYALTTGKTWFRVGETIRYDLEGRLGEGVSTKDLFLYIAGTYGDHANQNVEFGGSALPHLSIDARRTLTTMGAELSAEFATFEPDEVLIDYVKARNSASFEPQYPDPDALYAARHTIDLAALSPMVALPSGHPQRRAGRASRWRADPAGLHRLLRQRHAGRSRRGGSRAEGPSRGARRAPPGDAGIAAHRHGRGQGRLSADPPRSWCSRDAGDLRRLLWRTYGRPRAGRDLHHRLDAQLQGPHGRRDGAHLHGLARDGRRLGGGRPYRASRERIATNVIARSAATKQSPSD